MLTDIKGIIEIDKIFLDRYDYSTDKEILNEDFVEAELNGRREKFWFFLDSTKYLYKSQDIDADNIYAEIIAEEVARILDFECAEYKLATFKGNLGVVTKNFINKNEKLVLGAEILSDVLNKYALNNKKFLEDYKIDELSAKDSHNKLNNLEDIWGIIEIYLKEKGYKNSFIKQIMEDMVKKFFFDIITLQGDSHVSNWGLIENEKNKSIKFAPLFDNSNMCGLNRRGIIKTFDGMLQSAKRNSKDHIKLRKTEQQLYSLLYHPKLLFSVSENDIINIQLKKRKTNIEVLDYFLQVSSTEYCDMLEDYLNKIEKIGINEIITRREERDNIKIPLDVKKHIINSMSLNMIYLREKIENYNISKGGKIHG